MNYYNEHDKKAAAWIRELISAGVIAPGEVDERSIADVKSTELARYVQCHFFAGIGGWSYALRLAGWPDNRAVWTGSCPCQPLSCAGKCRGEKDERHLWPEFYRLISKRKPSTVLGEQVASKDGLEWLNGISLDLEELGYAVGSADLPAASVGAPHIRQRFFWVADSEGGDGGLSIQPGGLRKASAQFIWGGEISRMGNSVSAGLQGHSGNVVDWNEPGRIGEGADRSIAKAGRDCWSEYTVIPCGDGKARRIKPGIAPLVDGIPERVGLLRGYGNSIVPQVAQEFIAAYMEITGRALRG
jgi:DNA (cytosine-5)-methyltransferase 1